MRDPHERVAVDDREADELAALARKSVEQRLADVGHAGRHVEALAEHRETHRQPIETRVAGLLGPTEVDERREQPVGAAFRQRKPFGDFAERHLGCAVTEQLDDPKAALCRYVGHGSVSRVGRASARRAASDARAASRGCRRRAPSSPARKCADPSASVAFDTTGRNPICAITSRSASSTGRDLDQLEAVRADAEHRALGDEQRDLAALRGPCSRCSRSARASARTCDAALPCG